MTTSLGHIDALFTVLWVINLGWLRWVLGCFRLSAGWKQVWAGRDSFFNSLGRNLLSGSVSLLAKLSSLWLKDRGPVFFPACQLEVSLSSRPLAFLLMWVTPSSIQPRCVRSLCALNPSDYLSCYQSAKTCCFQKADLCGLGLLR